MRRVPALDLTSPSRLGCNGFVKQLSCCWGHVIDPQQMGSSNSLPVCSIRQPCSRHSSGRDFLCVQATGDRARTTHTTMLKYLHRGRT